MHPVSSCWDYMTDPAETPHNRDLLEPWVTHAKTGSNLVCGQFLQPIHKPEASSRLGLPFLNLPLSSSVTAAVPYLTIAALASQK